MENNVFKGLGAIIAASSVVINNIPPYCVVGSVSAKLLKVRWSLEGILENERIIYPEKSRVSIEFLKNSLCVSASLHVRMNSRNNHSIKQLFTKISSV